MPETTVTKMEPTPRIKKQSFSRVAIYSRVSTRSAAQLHSAASQVSELTRFAASRNDWRLVDIYMDFESASGANTRGEFARMIDDAENGLIDIVLTKSVQRFGRNTEENLITMRSLLKSGVVVYFQIEGYSSDMPEAELQTSLRSALAAADNASHREERIWGVRRKIEDGTSELYKRPCYGYKKNKDGVLIIDEDRAKIVRKIFKWYLSGKSIYGIKKSLEEEGIPSPSDKAAWPMRTIDQMLSNEKYTGKILLFKTVMVNYPYSVRRTNTGGTLREQYCMSNGVDEIIDEATFNAVQDEKRRRSNYEITKAGKRRKAKKYSSAQKEAENEPGNLSTQTSNYE